MPSPLIGLKPGNNESPITLQASINETLSSCENSMTTGSPLIFE